MSTWQPGLRQRPASAVKKKASFDGSGISRTSRSTSPRAPCRMGRLPATTMIANTNMGSVKFLVSR